MSKNVKPDCLTFVSKTVLSLYFLSFFLFFASCKKNPGQAPDNNPNPPEKFTTSTQYKLNVVYFVASDMQPLPNYVGRLSKTLFYYQSFYARQMKAYGFGYKSFALPTDTNGEVHFTVIKGNKPLSSYPYNGGAGPMGDEINAYYNAHPGEKLSEHFLILTAIPDGDNADAPYYGMGTWAYELDHPKFDLDVYGLSQKWLAGNAHELGHGLGLPHDETLVSQKSFGTSLMGAAYNDFAKSIIITKADAAILNNNQLFNDRTVSDYLEDFTCYIKRLNISYANNAIQVSGAYYSSKPVNGINLYQKPGTDDYSQVSWSVAPNNDNSFTATMPVNELTDSDGDFTLQISFLGTNGTQKWIVSYPFIYNNGTPAFNPNIGSKTEIDKAAWTVLDVDSQESGYPPSNVLDSNPATYWHTQYNGSEPPPPHTLSIDMHKINTLQGLTFIDRQGVWPGIKYVDVYTKTDNTDWALAGNFNLVKVDLPQFISFTQPVQARYFRIVAKSVFDNGRSCSLAEIGAY